MIPINYSLYIFPCITWCFKPTSKPSWLYVNRIPHHRSIVILSVSEGIFAYFLLHKSYRLPEGLNSWEELLNISVRGNCVLSIDKQGGKHIYCHSQTDCYVVCVYIYIYMCVCVCVCVYKHDLLLNNSKVLIFHKTQPSQNNQHSCDYLSAFFQCWWQVGSCKPIPWFKGGFALGNRCMAGINSSLGF